MKEDSENTFSQPVALVDVLDRVLSKGVVVAGQLTISVANVDLLDIHLSVVISSPDQRPSLHVRPSSIPEAPQN